MGTYSLPRSPRLLLITTVILAAAGVALLVLPHGAPTRTPASPSPEGTDSASLPPAASPAPAATHENTASASASARPVGASALPPHGEGAAGDPAIQKALEAAWPADLPAGDERRLLTAGRDLLRADATGFGRAKWPEVFPGQGVAPAFGTARFRIQAAIARRDGAPDRAVVHLVWAGADRGGAFTDGRITDWLFTRTTSKGVSTWTPQPRI
ncbi:hypothetical protein [Streptomyces lunaelactis]|uniref:hypothetical protein n=1 Tax=Streptomyces lunaelactis TaxID=1535768 RepID=UPI0020C82EB4|nr:hypothetical protein [Streptomyces lunaelactis]